MSKKGARDIFPEKLFDAVNGRFLPDISGDKNEQESFQKEIERQVQRVLYDGGKVIELN